MPTATELRQRRADVGMPEDEAQFQAVNNQGRMNMVDPEPLKDSGATTALQDFGPQAPLEVQFPARATAIARGRAMGLSDVAMKAQIEESWAQLKLAGLKDDQISEMFQGNRDFPPPIDTSRPALITPSTLDAFQKAYAPAGTEMAKTHTLRGYIEDAAKTVGGVVEAAVSGFTADIISPKNLEKAVAGPLFRDKLPEKPLAETAISESTKDIAAFVGSGVSVAALSGAPGLTAMAAKFANPGMKAAVQWGGAAFVYNALNQLADHGKIDIGKLALDTGEAALFAGIIGRLSGPAQTKLGELVGKKTGGASGNQPSTPNPSQKAHLDEAASEMEKSFGKSKPFQEAKMEVGESSEGGVAREKPRPNLEPSIAERETLTSSFKAKHPEVPEAVVGSMSNLQLKQKINWSYDPRQNLDNKSAMDRLANDRGYIPLAGENRWGVVSPGGGYRGFTSEDEMLSFLGSQPTKSLAPVHKAMSDVLEGTMNEETKSALTRQKVHVENGGREFTKDAPSGMGVRPVLAEGQLIKPYEQLFDEEGAKRMASNIGQDGLQGKIIPFGSRFMVLAVKPNSGEASRAVDLYQQLVSFRGADKPGFVKGLTPADYTWVHKAMGRELSVEDQGWVKGRFKNLAAATGMQSRRAAGHKAASGQIQSFFEQLPTYFAGKGITDEAGKNIERILARELGNELADARTLEPNITKRLAKIDAIRVSGGKEPITKDILAMLQRRPDR